MIIKVCGMRETENIRQVASLDINWIGFIFYKASERCVAAEAGGRRLETEQILFRPSVSSLRSPIKKVGVFVNASLEEMEETAGRYRLDLLQLHGDESPEVCRALLKSGYMVIKAFPIGSRDDFKLTAQYEGCADYFLFDTRCEGYGGSGKSFDWSAISAYKGNTPFLLSGGINPDSLEAIRNFHHLHLVGIDLNSGFETAPGIKDVDKLHAFIKEVRGIN